MWIITDKVEGNAVYVTKSSENWYMVELYHEDAFVFGCWEDSLRNAVYSARRLVRDHFGASGFDVHCYGVDCPEHI